MGAASALPPVPASRCEDPGAGVFSLGEDKPTEEGEPLPFAVEIGDGTAFEGGFAAGALIPGGNTSAKAAVVVFDAQGGNAKVISLGGAHGDTPPPRVAPAGTALLTALLESSAAGRRLRIGKIEGGALTWGPAFDQGRDESLAFDVVAGPSRSIVAWDDDAREPERGVVRVATFTTDALGAPSAPRTITGKDTDAELPRLVRRPGGYWLTWVARRPERVNTSDREPGEDAEFRWLEAVPLDELGAPTAPAKRLTPDTGHVLTYDVEEGQDGKAIAVYRDDDTPSGSGGGIVMKVVLRPDGASEPVVIADRNLGVGTPSLLSGWLAVADSVSETRLARLDERGELQESLDSEPVLGRGEPLAARGDALLVVRPRGKGVRLFVTRCHPSGVRPAASGDEPLPPAMPATDEPKGAE